MLLAVVPTLSGNMVTFQGDSSGNSLVLAALAGTLEYRVDGGTTFSPYLDTSTGEQTLAINAQTVIDATLGSGINSLTIDASLENALAANPGATVNDNATGPSDTLVGPTGTNQWSITGQNSGTLDGAVSFSNVANLTAAAGSADTFAFQTGGVLDGTLTGKGGSGEQMVLYGRIQASETITDTGATSGQVTFDETPIASFSGVSSIADDSENVTGSTGRTLVVNTPTAGDAIQVAEAGDGSSIVESGSSATPFPSYTFENSGVVGLDLDPGGGNSASTTGDATAAIDPLAAGFAPAVTVNAPDQVTLLNVTGPGGLTVNAGNGITAGPAIADQQQVPVTNWTPNQSYPLVGQTSTSGTGTGMVVSINVGSNGEPVATLVDFGSGYNPGDTVTFDPPTVWAIP